MSKEEFTVILSKSLPRLFPYSTPAPTDELPAETLKLLCLDFSLSCKLSRCKFATFIFTSLPITFPPFIEKSCPLILIS